MKKGLIEYSTIASLTANEAVDTINSSDKINFGEATLSDLLLKNSADPLSLIDYGRLDTFGGGVYIFFDNDTPVYVGKANNFLHRLSSHSNTVSNPGWGWNSLLQMICWSRLGISRNTPLTDSNLERALSVLETFSFVRINTSNAVQIENKKLERVFLRSYKRRYGASILNNRIKNVDDYYLNTNIQQLLLSN